MKGLLIFIALAAVLVGGLYALGKREPPVPEPAAAVQAPQVAVPQVAVPQVAVPPAATPRPAPPAAPRVSWANRVKAALPAMAERTRVKIVKFDPGPNSIELTVQWSSDNMAQGADVIDLLRREGLIRRFEDLGGQRGYTPDGRRLLTMNFKIWP